VRPLLQRSIQSIQAFPDGFIEPLDSLLWISATCASQPVSYNPKKQKGGMADMKAIIFLALMASPALADVYRCTSGGRTVYQDMPCANARVVGNINGLPPSQAEQTKTIQRADRDRNLAAELVRNRESHERSAVTMTQTRVAPKPASTKSNRPDRYYSRPDKFNNRAASSPPYIQRK
jgi:hypothetical protein